jgi:hypothetical protein
MREFLNAKTVMVAAIEEALEATPGEAGHLAEPEIAVPATQA